MTERKRKDWLTIGSAFYQSDERILRCYYSFLEEIRKAMAGGESSLAKERTFIGLPTGSEWGRYIAVDFGGSTIRAARIFLTGKGYYVIERKAMKSLRVSGEYDLTAEEATGDTLFDALAELVEKVADKDKRYVLGHTFSFGVDRKSLADGVLTAWSKEIRTSGVEGKAVNELLKEALKRRGLIYIEPIALINDTTAALLAAAYTEKNCPIGLVCGTGFNMCCYDAASGEIVNLEAGGYDYGERTVWDYAADTETRQPGFHVFEKMVSGGYVSRVFQKVVTSYLGCVDIPHIGADRMNELITSASIKQLRVLAGKFWHRLISPEEAEGICNLGTSLFVRASQLMGTSVAAVLTYLYGKNMPSEQVVIAVEGSICLHVRGCLPVMAGAAQTCLSADDDSDQTLEIVPHYTADGALVGAAIAAAIAMADGE